MQFFSDLAHLCPVLKLLRAVEADNLLGDSLGQVLYGLRLAGGGGSRDQPTFRVVARWTKRARSFFYLDLLLIFLVHCLDLILILEFSQGLKITKIICP